MANFSELTSLLVEHAPLELSRVLSELIVSQKFILTVIVQVSKLIRIEQEFTLEKIWLT